jgi:acyl-CoA synthetase (AMP-forming)/AMP-acid ligase II
MTGREYTYEMAYGMSRKFGSALKRLGAKKGDCLCMVVPNIPEFPIAFFGAAGVGVVLTTMNPTYRPGNSKKITKSRSLFQFIYWPPNVWQIS